MKLLTEIFFYGYVGLLIIAGGWGVLGARLDHRLLFGMDPSTLERRTGASLVSQYRFLRAIECGFGLFALLWRHEIFTERPFNRLFLATMTLGVVARVVSLLVEGRPRPIFYFFLGSEAIGAILIFAYTRGTLCF
ncbi:MAG: DUF4345 family protein [Hyalangium sp.]|uniref:DUF4345 family protein n=1 Tax=Hyalangium sp. TaxID=2028555 RepID=UPI00389AE405